MYWVCHLPMEKAGRIRVGWGRVGEIFEFIVNPESAVYCETKLTYNGTVIFVFFRVLSAAECQSKQLTDGAVTTGGGPQLICRSSVPPRARSSANAGVFITVSGRLGLQRQCRVSITYHRQ